MPNSSNVFSIRPEAHFLRTLRDALLSGIIYNDIDAKSHRISLADVTIFLPTRRSVQSLKSLFGELNIALALPDIRPLADIDSISAYDENREIQNHGAPKTISSNTRILLLAQLVSRWHDSLLTASESTARDLPPLIGGTPFEFFHLAAELARLLDTFTIHGVTRKSLEESSPLNQDHFWRLNHQFITIVTEQWPLILDAFGLSDPVMMHNQRVNDLAAALEDKASNQRIIIAGSTGSIPSTARLIKAVARQKYGRIILPGLNFHYDDKIFHALQTDPDQAGHAQFNLAKLVAILGTGRNQVSVIGSSSEQRRARDFIVSRALTPAAATAAWVDERSTIHAYLEQAFQDCTFIEAADEHQESKAIACIIREAAENPETTVALVTPDRELVDRIKAVLDRWDISYHDTADVPFAKKPTGSFLMALAEWMARPEQPEPLCALLANPAARFSLPREDVQKIIGFLDLDVFRNNVPPRSALELLQWIESVARQKISTTQPDFFATTHVSLEAVLGLVELLRTFHNTFFAASLNRTKSLSELIEAHACLLKLAVAGSDEHEAAPLFEAMNQLRETLPSEEIGRFQLTASDYLQILQPLLGKIRQPLFPPKACNIYIYGLLEARLMHADRIILAGLNEQNWPAQPQPDAFLPRSVKNALGLPQPERSIGQTAHDFTQSLMAADHVTLSRALKSAGTPTIASRFLQRLSAFVGKEDPSWRAMESRGKRYLHLAEQLDNCNGTTPALRPSPVITASQMPQRITITEAETLVRDPYAFFARRVLRLRVPEQWNSFSEAQVRGIILHDAFSAFVKEHIDDVFFLSRWEMQIDELMKRYPMSGMLRLFWRRPLIELGSWYSAWNAKRIRTASVIMTEQKGAMDVPLAAGKSIQLVGRADRLEMHTDYIAIIDFKTGRVPTKKSAESGLSPQLILEAAMAAKSAFGKQWASKAVAELIYVGIDSMRSTGKETRLFADDANGIPALAQNHLRSLQSRLSRHANGELGFVSRRFPAPGTRDGDYDHLARVAEWARLPGQDSDE